MSTPLLAGTKLGRYVIRSLIGTGGMGEVYLADDTLLRRPVAIKLLIGDFSLKAERLHRFEREAYAASSLNHPNIVTIHEIGAENGHHFIATEYVDGESLREHTRRSRMDAREITEVAIQVASALTAAHETGIIHRDIKPENIMLRRDGYVKVLDFGLAKLSDEGWTGEANPEAATQLMVKTEPGRVMGTIEYMSPEQARGREVDPRSDIFSFGIVLYELVAGVKPFVGETKSDTLAAVLTSEVMPLVQRSPEVPVELSRIVTKCLKKHRDERYQSAKELLTDLKNLRQELEFAEKMGLTVSSAGIEATPTQLSIAPTTQSRASYPSTISELFIQEVKTHPRRSFLFFGVVGLALIAVGIGVFKLVKFALRKDTFQNMRLARLTNSGDINEATIAVSPDGNYVAYATTEAGEQKLWVRQVATSSTIQIVPAGSVDYTGVTFSPEGGYVFYTVEERRQHANLYRVPVLGGSSQKLIDDANGPISFSPDKTRIVYRRSTSNNTQLLTARVDGSDERPLGAQIDRRQWLDAAWSPTNQNVIVAAAISPVDNRVRLVEISVEDGKEKALGNDAWNNDTGLGWLPDGSGLLMSARDLDTKYSQLWLIEFPSGTRRRITNDLANYFGVSLTSDSNTLVTIQLARTTNLWVVPIDGAAPQQITSEAGRDEGLSGLDYTPDGRLVYTVRLVATADLWMIDADGKNEKQLTLNSGRNFFPLVTSDGKYIVFVSDRSGRNQIWRMDIDGRNPRQLTDESGVSGRFSLSPLDSSIYYPIESAKGSTIWRVGIDGGQSTQVIKVASDRPVVSPDGKMLLFEYVELTSNTRKVATASVNGDSLKLYDFPEVLKSNMALWSPDGLAIIYRVGQKRVDNLWSQNLAGGPPTQITQFSTDQIFGFRWSASRREYAMPRGRDGSDVVLFNNFR